MARNSFLLGLLALWLTYCATGCGGGAAGGPGTKGAGSGGTGGTGSGGAGGGGGSGGAVTAGAAEGLWAGRFPVLFGLDFTSGDGIVTADGTGYFIVARGAEGYFGTVTADSGGVVRSDLAHYGTSTSAPAALGAGLGGGQPLGFRRLRFERAIARSSLDGHYQGALSRFEPLTLDYGAVYERPAALATLAGVYSVTEDPNYVLTVSVNSDGQLTGSDTKGCNLVGNVTLPDAARNVYHSEADVSSCAGLDGHYAGIMSLSDLASVDDNRTLFLALRSVSPVIGQSAIFHFLSR